MMLREVKPRNARSARALAKREPQVHEGSKKVLFLKGTSTSSLVNDAAADLHSLRKPLAVRFSKKNAIHPFEDASSFEFFAQKNDASLLCFGSHSKKRPHCLTFARTFGGQLLDMLECTISPDSARTMKQFGSRTVRSGLKPMLAFSGLPFEGAETGADAEGRFALAKSLFTDFFKGEDVGQLDVEGLQCLISFAAAEEPVAGGEARQMVYMRVWKLVTKRSGQKVPRVELEEIGPRLDFRLGRTKTPEPALMKEAMKQAKGAEARSKKNIETDIMGDKTGRIHVGRQDLDQLQTRKMKGLKRGRDEKKMENVNDEEEEDEDDEDAADGESDMSDIDMEDLTAVAEAESDEEPTTPKRQRVKGPA